MTQPTIEQQIALLTCPFCDSKTYKASGRETGKVSCDNSDCRLSARVYFTPEQWNTRATLSAASDVPDAQSIETVMLALRTLDDVGRFSENLDYVTLAGNAVQAFKRVAAAPPAPQPTASAVHKGCYCVHCNPTDQQPIVPTILTLERADGRKFTVDMSSQPTVSAPCPKCGHDVFYGRSCLMCFTDNHILPSKEAEELALAIFNDPLAIRDWRGTTCYPNAVTLCQSAITAAEVKGRKGRRTGLQSLDDKAIELYQRDKENGIRDRDSSALDMISAIRALIDKEAGG